jgi:hypothetical protein
MTFLYAIRYFFVVPVVPPLFSAAFAVAIVAAALRLISDVSAAIDALTPVLLLQLFVASSGFRFAARRGYYDLLLTSGTPRWQIALAHCLVSVLPGIVSWFCVAVLEVAASRTSSTVSFAPGTWWAFVGSSLIAWSVAVFSSRTTTTVLWLLVMTIPAISRVISPVQLLGASWTAADPLTFVTACVVVLAAFAMAIASVVRGQAPLEAAQ